MSLMKSLVLVLAHLPSSLGFPLLARECNHSSKYLQLNHCRPDTMLRTFTCMISFNHHNNPLKWVTQGEGNGNPLQYSCLENPMDGGAWWAAVHGVTKSRTRLSDFTFTFHFSLSCIGEGNGNPLQCSCRENPRVGGAWWAAVYGVTQSRTRLKQLSSNHPH